jgi:tetratricopeptide (TPR) repeat protein
MTLPKRGRTDQTMNTIRKAWIILKVFFAYFIFWTFPTPEEEFYIMKGDYYLQLGWHDRAAKSYRKAEKTSPDGHTDSAIGYRFGQMGRHDEAVQAYRQGTTKPGGQRAKLGLAIEEYDAGDVEKSESLMRELQASGKLTTGEKNALDILEIQLAVTKKARADYKKDRH